MKEYTVHDSKRKGIIFSRTYYSHSNEPNLKQTTYQILVSTNKETLSQDIGDVWDSGKVISDETDQIAYNGTRLESETTSFWKVRVWDNSNNPSRWSEPSFWKMGLLNQND